MTSVLHKLWRTGRVALLVGGVLATGGAAALLAASRRPTDSPTTAAPKVEPDASDKVRRTGADALIVPDAVAKNIGLRTAAVAVRTHPIPLPPLQGCLAVDSSRLARVHSRFAGEVVALGTATEPAAPTLSTEPTAPAVRPLRVGDPIRAGDLLAVVWSKDLGEKKSELVDALSKLRSDETTLRRLTDSAATGSIPERTVRDAERAVESDRVAVERAERTLRAWRLTDAELAAVRAEAERIAGHAADKADPGAGRVEVRAPADGVVLEKNVGVGDIVDTAADLFKVGDLSHLTVWAHAYEEDLPLIQAVPRPARWLVHLPSRPGSAYPGRMEQVGAVIDPNQHTALVTGRVENPDGDLKVGQFVTVAVDLPPAAGELELPTTAVIEDGRESLVFVRPVGADGRLVRTPVEVTRRFRDVVCVRAGGELKAGDEVVSAGALLLRDAMEQLPPPRP